MLLSSLLVATVVGLSTPEACESSPHGAPLARVGGAETPPVAHHGADSTLVALYESGVTWEQFLTRARARREMWVRNAEQAQVPADVLARAQALPGSWRLLAVSVDRCSDSVNTIPYVARLAALVPSIELRIISPEQGRELMAARRTPDGRAATPTIVLLDAEGTEVGCWIERPAALQAIAIEANAGGGTSSFAARKQAWYDEDQGASTVAEVVALLAAAAEGARGCDAAPPSRGQ